MQLAELTRLQLEAQFMELREESARLAGELAKVRLELRAAQDGLRDLLDRAAAILKPVAALKPRARKGANPQTAEARR